MNPLRMNRKKKLLVAAVFILAVFAAAGTGLKHRTQTQIKELFRMNKELQEDGYYMGDFEFKMLGMAYWLDHGHYIKALTRLDAFHQQLETKECLLRVPAFSSKKEELAFYLDLQNPNTGAFMDDTFPYCTYHEITENLLDLLDALAKESGQPLRLKYPLKYLDAINTPEKLRAFLDDTSHAGWIAAKFPNTSFVFARSLLSCANGEGVIGEEHLYDFSEEWKQALLQWFYDNQDSETGFWGPKSRYNGRLLRKDLTNTASVIKAFVDREGNDIHEAFPLRYRREMFKTALAILMEPPPAEDELQEWHEWALKMGKGVHMLTLYLWKDASPSDKADAKRLIENFIKLSFDKYYVAQEGAFSYYPHSNHATLDGTGGKINDLVNVGFLSAEMQKRLWGGMQDAVEDLGEAVVAKPAEKDLEAIENAPGVNSIRFYPAFPESGDFMSNVLGVYYPKSTSVLDVMELMPRLKEWIGTTPQSMGNWVSRARITQELQLLSVHAIPVYRKEVPFKLVEDALAGGGQVLVVGFDVLQTPKCRLMLVSKRI